MKKTIDYKKKFDSYRNKTLFGKLSPEQQRFIEELAFNYRFSFQEFRQVVEASRDLTMWGEEDIISWWGRANHDSQIRTSSNKKTALSQLKSFLNQLKQQEKVYPEKIKFTPAMRESRIITTDENDKKIFGMCPVASDKTICCNLYTIDAVENCVFGCSYCTIQTFYEKDIRIQKNIREKLNAISIDNNRFYHFGTGQSSDSLVWGNRDGILDAHIEFAASHPNILMEFKTKSNNIRYFIENRIPDNIVCSWSLNTDIIIKNEEHFTASLPDRISSARECADAGIKVAFHFHPLVWYKGWSDAYTQIAAKLMENFDSQEVLFISFGSITFIKPVIQKIRNLGNPTKTLQMEFVTDPHGKMTYPDQIKIEMFKQMYKVFSPWKDEVFFYLCMEKADIWKESLGYIYENNDQFEEDFGKRTMAKI